MRKKQILELLNTNFELSIRAFRGEHKTPEAKELIKLLRGRFNYSKLTSSMDIFRVAKALFIKENSYSK